MGYLSLQECTFHLFSYNLHFPRVTSASPTLRYTHIIHKGTYTGLGNVASKMGLDMTSLGRDMLVSRRGNTSLSRNVYLRKKSFARIIEVVTSDHRGDS